MNISKGLFLWILFVSTSFKSFCITDHQSFNNEIKLVWSNYEKCLLTDTILINKYIEQAHRYAAVGVNKRILFYSNFFLGNYYDSKIDYDKAIKYYYEALHFSDAIKNKSEVAELYDKLVEIYNISGNKELINKYTEKAVKLKQQNNDSVGIFISKLRLKHKYCDIDLYLNVLNEAFKALQYGEKINDTTLIIQAYNSIGVTYSYLGYHDKALTYYYKNIELFSLSKNSLEYGLLLNNFGEVYLHTKQYQEALQYFNKSITILSKFNRVKLDILSYSNLGIAYSHLGNNDKAIDIFKKNIQKCFRLKESFLLADLYYNLSYCYYKKTEYNKAIEYQRLTYRISKQNNYNELLANSCKMLSNIYSKQGKLKQAYRYLTKYTNIKSDIDYFKNDFVFNAEYNYLNHKNDQIRESKKEYELLRLFVIFLILVFAVFFLIYSLRRFHRKSRVLKGDIISLEKIISNLNNQSDKKEKELMSVLLQLINYNTEREFVVKRLTKIKADLNVSLKLKIQEIINEINLKIDKDLWDQFEVRFFNIHSEFYNKLLAANPNLTPGEKRLCALLFLNFSPKEISAITKQSYRSVLVARSRLKNKLNLTDSEELSNFLNQL
ncbi:MAG: tetratricopeptide repeat protein [Bacteroidales bacterium]|nr:tetratricopeptide repeat protein [Bacteroidales bacterium]